MRKDQGNSQNKYQQLQSRNIASTSTLGVQFSFEPDAHHDRRRAAKTHEQQQPIKIVQNNFDSIPSEAGQSMLVKYRNLVIQQTNQRQQYSAEIKQLKKDLRHQEEINKAQKK